MMLHQPQTRLRILPTFSEGVSAAVKWYTLPELGYYDAISDRQMTVEKERALVMSQPQIMTAGPPIRSPKSTI